MQFRIAKLRYQPSQNWEQHVIAGEPTWVRFAACLTGHGPEGPTYLWVDYKSFEAKGFEDYLLPSWVGRRQTGGTFLPRGLNLRAVQPFKAGDSAEFYQRCPDGEDEAGLRAKYGEKEWERHLLPVMDAEGNPVIKPVWRRDASGRMVSEHIPPQTALTYLVDGATNIPTVFEIGRDDLVTPRPEKPQALRLKGQGVVEAESDAAFDPLLPFIIGVRAKPELTEKLVLMKVKIGRNFG